MSELVRLRVERVSERGGEVLTGFIATDNLRSLIGTMKQGFWLAGLGQDKYCLNYITCWLSPAHRPVLEQTEAVAIADLDRLSVLLARGWVGTHLQGGPIQSSASIVMRYCPELA